MPSLWDEFRQTEGLVRRAERAYAAGEASRTQSPFVAQPLSNIRERILTKMLDRASEPSFYAPELQRAPDLYPGDKSSLDERLAPRAGATELLKRQLALIRAQDLAAGAQEKWFAGLTPLEQSRTRRDWYRRSEIDRTAAIAGLLRFERRRSATLKREAVGRAKSIDAARGIRDPYVVTDADLENKLDNSDLLDPCSEYKLREKRRQEVMFAKGWVVKGGYPGQRPHRSPC